jgi:hypothetical protein
MNEAAASLAVEAIIHAEDQSTIKHTLEAVRDAAILFERRAGVYFLFQDDELVYIGQSLHAPARLLDHTAGVHGDPERPWNRVAILAFPAEQLKEKEKVFIQQFKPRYNRQIRPSVYLACTSK